MFGNDLIAAFKRAVCLLFFNPGPAVKAHHDAHLMDLSRA